MKTKGLYTIKWNTSRFQIYYPQIIFRKNEFYVGINSNIRIIITKDYWGIGFNVLGFGLGYDYAK
jgi:hypothetical protein